MNSPHLSLCILLFCATALTRAEDVRAGKSKGARYELKTRSSFNLPESTRPPFWPIGWAKRGATAAAPVRTQTGPRYVLDERNFAVTSILTGNPSLAVINGRSYSEGEVLRMPKGTGGVRIRVLRIGDGFVQLRLDDQVVAPKLRREEIEPKRATEELLIDEER